MILMPTQAPERPVLRYFGSKWELAPWIIEHFPVHRMYVEPFGGGAGVLLRKQRSHLEIYNDLDGQVVNLFRVLRDKGMAERLKAAVSLSPFSREEYELARSPSDDPVEQARRTLMCAYFGHGSSGALKKVGFRANSAGAGSPGPRVWKEYPNHIDRFCDRLRDVVIENRPAAEIMEAMDAPDTLHFVDPPYVLSTRVAPNVYRHEMSDHEHEELCELLCRLKGFVILCGYPNPIYNSLGWQVITRDAQADGAAERTEVLWLNDAAANAQSQGRLF